MQQIATKVFIYASLVFGIVGVTMVLAGLEPGDSSTLLGALLSKVFVTSIFVILPSFALSVAGKFLDGKF